MPEATTTLMFVEPKSGSNQKGPWSFRIFTDSAGRKFQTDFNDSLDYPIGVPVTVVYEDVQRGNFTNKVIKSILPAGNAQATQEPQNNGNGVSATPTAPQAPSDDLIGRIRTYGVGPLSAAMWSDLPAEERTFENAKAILDKLVQHALSNSINF